jgi:hypothetical protein
MGKCQRLPQCRGQDELFLLGGITEQINTTSPPYIAKLNTSTMTEVWRKYILGKPIHWQ